jgi:Mg2+/Co2+ transporter CorB
MNTITKIIISIFGIKKKKSDESLTTDELKSVLSTENNTFISKSHKEILIGVLDLEKISVDEIMVPRNELFAININDDWKDIQKQITNTPHTRILLYRNSIDDIIGFIHTRDALRLLTKEDFSKENLLRTIEEAYFIPENTNLLVQLQKFRRNKKRCGLVIDEYGDIQGLVTIDDILEEIVGDFTTSIDVDLDEEIIKQKDGSFIIDGQTTIRDLNKELAAELDTSGPVTLNGIILETLGDNPKKNVTVNLGNFTATIIETDGISISKVKLTPKQKENEQDGGS